MAKIMIMAGGTGGHVFPGLALAEALSSQQVQVCWLGTVNGMEAKWVQQANIPFSQISIKGLRGNGLLGWLKAPMNVTFAWWQARQLMQQQKPDLVLGMGGFVCGPGGLAAKSLGIPFVLHEQNAIPGLTNKLLARFAKKMITAFPQKVITGDNVVQIGNPIRSGLESIEITLHSPRHLLVLGGSRGALILNEMLPLALAKIPLSQRPKVIHQTGEKTFSQAVQAYEKAGVQADVVPFIEDMVEAYSQADLVVCRSGALTVSELMGAARPAIMIPFPYAVDDHQTANAQVLVAFEGGQIIQQTELTADKLAIAIQQGLEESALIRASQSIREKAPKQAKEQIVSLLIQLVNEKH